MNEVRLDKDLERLHNKFTFLWKDHGFHVKYFTRDHGMHYKGLIIGLENDLFKLVFEKETNSQVELIREYAGAKRAIFAPQGYSYRIEDGWYPLPSIICWLSGVQCEQAKDVEQDLENISQYLKLHIDKLLDLFRNPNDFEQKLEYYKKLYKDKQITVEKVRAERARLQALGQDSSLEAAITSLRGGKQ